MEQNNKKDLKNARTSQEKPILLVSARIYYSRQDEGHPGMHIKRRAIKIPGERRNSTGL